MFTITFANKQALQAKKYTFAHSKLALNALTDRIKSFDDKNPLYLNTHDLSIAGTLLQKKALFEDIFDNLVSHLMHKDQFWTDLKDKKHDACFKTIDKYLQEKNNAPLQEQLLKCIGNYIQEYKLESKKPCVADISASHKEEAIRILFYHLIVLKTQLSRMEPDTILNPYLNSTAAIANQFRVHSNQEGKTSFPQNKLSIPAKHLETDIPFVPQETVVASPSVLSSLNSSPSEKCEFDFESDPSTEPEEMKPLNDDKLNHEQELTESKQQKAQEPEPQEPESQEPEPQEPEPQEPEPKELETAPALSVQEPEVQTSSKEPVEVNQPVAVVLQEQQKGVEVEAMQGAYIIMEPKLEQQVPDIEQKVIVQPKQEPALHAQHLPEATPIVKLKDAPALVAMRYLDKNKKKQNMFIYGWPVYKNWFISDRKIPSKDEIRPNPIGLKRNGAI